MKNVSHLFLVILGLYLTACNQGNEQSPEQQVADTLSAIEIGVEERSLPQIMKHISESYKDHRGHTKKDIKQLMQLQLLRNQQINIFTRVQSINIDQGIASVELSTAIASRGVDLSVDSNRLKADTHRFSIVLVAQKNDWLIQSASWERGW